MREFSKTIQFFYFNIFKIYFLKIIIKGMEKSNILSNICLSSIYQIYII